MTNKEGKDKIYEELKGYFPPEYDLTPDELEKEIETENKKREIALGMMRTKLTLSQTAQFARLSQTATNIDIKGSKRSFPEKVQSSDPIEKIAKEPEAIPSAAEEPNTLQSEEELSEIIEDAVSEIAPEESITKVDEPSEDISKSKIQEDEISDIPLRDLFEEMENGDLPEDEESNENGRKTVSWIFDFLEVFTVCITLIIVIFAFFARLTEVSGDSMVDTLHNGERLIVSDFMYEPKIGDIVVLQNTSVDGDILREPLVKRVIALGGQTVDISAEGIVTVTKEDGSQQVLEQPYVSYINPSYYKDGIPYHFEIPEGYVFVLGDNRNNSSDSRGALGLVDERCIFGKAVARILPISEFEIFENPYDN